MVRTRPLEFDSALKDDFRLWRSAFEVLRDLSQLQVSWTLVTPCEHGNFVFNFVDCRFVSTGFSDCLH